MRSELGELAAANEDDEQRSAEEGGDDADLDLAGPATTRPMTSAPRSRIGAEDASRTAGASDGRAR